jgi:hypothetical protein
MSAVGALLLGLVAEGGRPVANDKQTEIYYRLARSVVRISGTVVEDVDPSTAQPRRIIASKVAVGVEADPRLAWRCKLPTHGSFWKDRQSGLTLAEDGRLVGSTGIVTGRGGAAVVAGIRVAALVGSFALRLAGVPVGIGRDRGEAKSGSVEAAYADEHADDAARRELFRSTIAALQDAVVNEASRVPEVEDPAPIVAKVRELRSVLAAVREEAALLEQQFDSWRAARFPVRREAHAYALGTDELPQYDTAADCLELGVATLPAALQAAVASLGLIVVRIGDPEEGAPNFTSEDLKQQSGIWFRTARPVMLAVYEHVLDAQEDTEKPATFRLNRLARLWVVDSGSTLGFLRYESGVFGKHAAGLRFGPGGALTSISSASSAPVGAVVGAAGDAGAAIRQSVAQAAEISAGLGEFATGGAEDRLAELNRRRETLDADISYKGALATSAQRGELERVKAEADLIEARRSLGPAIGFDADRAGRELNQQVGLTRLEVGLSDLRTQLESLRGKGD